MTLNLMHEAVQTMPPDHLPQMSAEARRIQVIRDVIEEIRPNLRRDGGDCEFIGLEDSKVMIRLTGACVMCRLSAATLENIQARVVERLGEFVRLVPVPTRSGTGS